MWATRVDTNTSYIHNVSFKITAATGNGHVIYFKIDLRATGKFSIFYYSVKIIVEQRY